MRVHDPIERTQLRPSFKFFPIACLSKVTAAFPATYSSTRIPQCQASVALRSDELRSYTECSFATRKVVHTFVFDSSMFLLLE